MQRLQHAWRTSPDGQVACRQTDGVRNLLRGWTRNIVGQPKKLSSRKSGQAELLDDQ
jgi:hypothetical protein